MSQLWLMLSAIVLLVAAQQQPAPQQTQQQLQPQLQANVSKEKPSNGSLTVPEDGNLVELHGHPVLQSPNHNKDLWPVVNVDRHQNKSKVDVHVPVFFDMTNQNDPDGGRSKLDLSVLQGLVTISKDKARNQDGRMDGPFKVTVFGIPVYNSKGTASSGASSRPSASARNETIARQEKELEASLGSARAALNARADAISERVRDNLQKSNEKVMKSLSDIMDKLLTILKKSPIPANSPSKYPLPSNDNPINTNDNQAPVAKVDISTNDKNNSLDTRQLSVNAKI